MSTVNKKKPGPRVTATYSFSVEDLAKAQLYTDINLSDVDFPVTISNRVLNSQWMALPAPQRRLYLRDAERVIQILVSRRR